MTFAKEPLTDALCEQLIAMSRDWEAEQSCHGYVANGVGDIEDKEIFTASENGRLVGYLLGKCYTFERDTSVIRKGTVCFEIAELYVVPELRCRGIGSGLFRFAEDAARGNAQVLDLSTAVKDHRAILRFYIDELGMEFWNARLFKKL